MLLSACNSPRYNQTEANVGDVKIKSQEAHQKFDHSLKPAPALVVKNGAYVDLTPISIEKNPAWLQNHIVIRGDQLPFSYYSRTLATGAGTQVLAKYQSELDQTVGVSMNYSGTVKGALDLLATKTGYVYEIKNKQIYWQSLISKTFDIAFFPGSTDYSMGKTSAAASSSSTSSSSTPGKPTAIDLSDGEYSSLSGKLSVWKDLETSVKGMLSKDGTVVVSESTASVTVRDKATNLQLVEQYINTLNKNLSRQVLVKVQILEVSLNDAFNFGINWNIINKAFQNTSYTLTDATFGKSLGNGVLTLSGSSDYPSLGLQNVSGGNFALINALNQQGKTSVVSEPRVMAVNNQVTVVRVVTQEAYVASVENTTQSAGTGGSNSVSSTVTPATITYGVTIYLLPKIMNEKVYLQVNADLSTKDNLVTYNTNAAVSGSTVTPQANNVSVQLPTVSQKHFNQRSMIRSGDTLILAGFRQLRNTANAQQLLRSQTLGGKGSLADNKETVILITPVIMDENR